MPAPPSAISRSFASEHRLAVVVTFDCDERRSKSILTESMWYLRISLSTCDLPSESRPLTSRPRSRVIEGSRRSQAALVGAKKVMARSVLLRYSSRCAALIASQVVEKVEWFALAK